MRWDDKPHSHFVDLKWEVNLEIKEPIGDRTWFRWELWFIPPRECRGYLPKMVCAGRTTMDLVLQMTNMQMGASTKSAILYEWERKKQDFDDWQKGCQHLRHLGY